MKFLRTASTRRLLATIAGAVAVIAAGTAIAVAASGEGPVPKQEGLAQAAHAALAAPAPQGISARIKFTNHLIDASNIQGSDPILSGATGRLWVSSNHQMRLELQGDNGDAQAVLNGGSFWVYDPTSNTVYKGKLPAERSASASKPKARQEGVPSVAQIKSDIARLIAHVDLTGAIPGDVAGRAAYTVRVSPKHDGGLLGAGELAWDAARGVPLRVAVYARNDSSPVLQLKATNISYGPVASSTFTISPPPSAKVVTVSTPGGGAADHGAKRDAGRRHAKITGAAAVARHLPFPLKAPKSLVGLRRQSVTLLDWNGSPAALVTYGQNVGAVAVIEQTAKPGASSQTGDHQGLSLPTVSINGATGQELDTALGTMVRFTRTGVSYTVVGSVPPTAADLAARAL
jgi:outer membrane lipoprotein-sorting protein